VHILYELGSGSGPRQSEKSDADPDKNRPQHCVEGTYCRSRERLEGVCCIVTADERQYSILQTSMQSGLGPQPHQYDAALHHSLLYFEAITETCKSDCLSKSYEF
jgi:hypothetical protein